MALHNTTTNDEFEKRVLKSEKYVLVDFWAQWCPPCRMMAPILETVAREKDAVLDVVKVDTEASADNQALAMKYGVRGIPNMQLFKDGKVVQEYVGMRPQHALEHELEEAGVK
jgi:thioredoxin 1